MRNADEYANGVSVIIPVYNREQYLEECVNSVIAQNCDFPVEIILADDGSTDRSREIALSLGSSVIWLDKPADCKTQGAGPTRNRGIAAAQYKHIAFLDSDDVFLPGHLERLYHFLEKHSEFGGAIDQLYVFHNELKKRRIIPYVDREVVNLYSIFLDPYYSLDSLMIRRAIIDQFEIPFEESLRFAQDIDFHFRVNELCKIAILTEPGSAYREGEQRSTAGSAKQYEYARLALQRAVKRYPYPAWLVRKRKAAIMFRLAQGDIAEKKYFSALYRLFYAGMSDPVRAVSVLLQHVHRRQK